MSSETLSQLLALLRYGYFQPNIAVSFSSDFAGPLAALAKAHRVFIPAATAWRRLSDAGRAPPLPADVAQDLLREREKALRAAAWLSKLGKQLDEAEVPWLAIKGPALSQQLHGDPAFRTSADLDILLPRPQLARAVAIAEAVGWRSPEDWERVNRITGTKDVTLAPCSPDRPYIEAHWRLTYGRFADRLDPFGGAQRSRVAIGGVSIPVLAGADLTAYLAWHGGVHFWHRLSWLFDLAILLRDQPDHEQMLSRARALGAETVFVGGALLASRLLGVAVPIFQSEARRAVLRITRLGEQRLSRGPEPLPAPYSYLWAWRSVANADAPAEELIARLNKALRPADEDVLRVGAARPMILHQMARPLLFGQRLLSSLVR